jgi:hypothetical protein
MHHLVNSKQLSGGHLLICLVRLLPKLKLFWSITANVSVITNLVDVNGSAAIFTKLDACEVSCVDLIWSLF